MMIEVKALTPAVLADWLAFFDGPGFADNPEWGDCYCRFFHYMGDNESWQTACESRENRAVQIERITNGDMRGYMAYDAGAPIGWVNAAPRSMYPKLDLFCPIDDAAVTGAVTCFVIASTHRRRGVARRLLEAACDGFRAAGLTVAEAFPAKPEVVHDGDAENYRGPLSLYQATGFTIAKELSKHYQVRKRLTAA